MCHPGRPLPHGLSQPQRSAPRPSTARSRAGPACLPDLDARAREQIVDLPVRELAVAREGADREVHVRPLRVGAGRRRPSRRDVLDQDDDLRDALADARLDVRIHAAASAQLVGVHQRHPLRQLERRPRPLGGALEDLVVHVGHVAHVRHPVAPGAQEPHEDVERHERPRVAGVRVVVGRQPADVDATWPGSSGSTARPAASSCCRGVRTRSACSGGFF
jgi:hypothetical protein